MKLIAIVEGHGDVAAVRVLLRRVLHEELQRYDVVVERSIGWLSNNMPTGLTYRETIDQAAFASRIDLEQARQCPSFDKFMREVRTLAHPSTSSLSNL